MANKPASQINLKDSTEKILLAYYNRSAAEIGQDKAAGDAIYNFFIAIISAAVGVLVVLMQLGKSAELIVQVALLVLGVLIFYGYLTHARVIRLQINWRRKLLQMYWVEQYFVDQNQQLEKYLFDRFSPAEHASLISMKFALLVPNLRQNIAIINVILSGTFGYILIARVLSQSVIVSVVLALIICLVYYFWQAFAYKRQTAKQLKDWQNKYPNE